MDDQLTYKYLYPYTATSAVCDTRCVAGCSCMTVLPGGLHECTILHALSLFFSQSSAAPMLKPPNAKQLYELLVAPLPALCSSCTCVSCCKCKHTQNQPLHSHVPVQGEHHMEAQLVLPAFLRLHSAEYHPGPYGCCDTGAR